KAPSLERARRVSRGGLVTELELVRTSSDRRLYSVDGVGTVRLGGLLSRTAFAEAHGQTWRFTRISFWRRAMVATDSAGAVVGEFRPRDVRRGGGLLWGGRELALRPVSALRERYALEAADRELAVFDGRGWGRRPVRITLATIDELDPGLLLFAAFVVPQAGVDAAAAAAAGFTAVVSS